MFSRHWAGQGGQNGFNLVELMVVVAIIGILSALALPRLRNFQVKARQSEGMTNLSTIYALQEVYMAETAGYGNLDSCGADLSATTGVIGCDTISVNDIAFMLNGNAARYSYSAEADNGASGGGATFVAKAISGTGANNRVLNGCQADHMEMNNSRDLSRLSDITKQADCGTAN